MELSCKVCGSTENLKICKRDEDINNLLFNFTYLCATHDRRMNSIRKDRFHEPFDKIIQFLQCEYKYN